MNILHINLARGFRGGERQTLLLIKALAEHYPNCQQALLTRYDSPLQEQAMGIKNLERIKIRRFFPWRLLNLKKHDVIHAHEAKACHLAWLLFSMTKTPYLITRRMDRAPKNNGFTRRVYRHCGYLVSLSSAIADIMTGIYPELPNGIIPSMKASLEVNPDRVRAIRQGYPNKILAGHVGALVARHKGQDYLLEAARLLEKSRPELHFLLLGEGVDEPALKQRAAELSNVSFIGFKHNIGDYYQAFDIFLFPSLEEGLGSALLDAMDAQLPIIASRVGGIPDIIRDGENGRLIPARDATAMVNAIVELLDNNVLARKLAAQARRDAEDYQPTQISQSYMNIYQTLAPA